MTGDNLLTAAGQHLNRLGGPELCVVAACLPAVQSLVIIQVESSKVRDVWEGARVGTGERGKRCAGLVEQFMTGAVVFVVAVAKVIQLPRKKSVELLKSPPGGHVFYTEEAKVPLARHKRLISSKLEHLRQKLEA